MSPYIVVAVNKYSVDKKRIQNYECFDASGGWTNFTLNFIFKKWDVMIIDSYISWSYDVRWDNRENLRFEGLFQPFVYTGKIGVVIFKSDETRLM